MHQYRNEAHKFFSNLTDEEFYKVLEEAGFELESVEEVQEKGGFYDETK